MTTAIIADDEAHLADYLAALLKRQWPELTISGIAHNGVDALRLIDDHCPDIAFLDIRMPGMTGLDVARKLSEYDEAPAVVFVTAYDEHALEAFNRAAVDYILKPPTEARLAETIKRLRTRIQPARADAQPTSNQQALLEQLAGLIGGQSAPARKRMQWLHASQGSDTRMISIDEVVYLQANDKYVSIFTDDGSESLIRTPLKELADQLDTDQFWQIHRGTIVNTRHIAGTTRDFTGRLLVKLKDRNERLPVSRIYLSLFKQM
ncbi:LytTR family DNA-binding domain-containing protein [Burkholderiaceae bacterium DAT-1]|nr:LytTR family DNA-binding domain-containing protein [Burkholderiaceae bacterium DAT-1]